MRRKQKEHKKKNRLRGSEDPEVFQLAERGWKVCQVVVKHIEGFEPAQAADTAWDTFFLNKKLRKKKTKKMVKKERKKKRGNGLTSDLVSSQMKVDELVKFS